LILRFWTSILLDDIHTPSSDGASMITAAQMRAARALLGIDQRQLAELSGVSLPTIQRMEASEGNVRGVVDTLTKVVEAFDAAGIELIGENVRSVGNGRGVRFKQNIVASGRSD
jgi:transcriptional regulator with XRE-family HTH domain